MRHWDVIIIGAGAAGLSAARRLSGAGRSVLILEARPRIGGRIMTIRDPALAMPVELGAEFVHGRPEATWALIREARMLAYDLPFEHVYRQGSRTVHFEDYSKELGKAMGGLARLRHDVSFAEYLRGRRLGRGRLTPLSIRLARDFVEGFDAADAERISAMALAKEQEGLGDLEEETQFRLLGGYGGLIEHLRRSLDGSMTSIRTRTVVSEVRWGASRVEVVCGSRGAARPLLFRARRVIITIPLGVLQLPSDAPGSIRFVPDVHRAAGQLSSGPVIKVVLRFGDAFWEDAARGRKQARQKLLRNASFMHDADAPFPTWWTARPLRQPVLTGWVGGPRALALSGVPRSRLLRAAAESLASILHHRTGDIARRIERLHTHDWPADPFARGAYSYQNVGGSRARAILARPVKSTLFFAGEATDTSGQASTVAGALASGELAAGQVFRSLRA